MVQKGTPSATDPELGQRQGGTVGTAPLRAGCTTVATYKRRHSISKTYLENKNTAGNNTRAVDEASLSCEPGCDSALEGKFNQARSNMIPSPTEILRYFK